MYHVSAQGIDERMINVHYYIYMAIGLNCSLWHYMARFGRCTLAFDLAVVVLQ